MPIISVSDQVAERSRNIEGLLYKSLQERTSQKQVAENLGIDQSTLSRFLKDHMKTIAVFLATAELKVVPVDAKTLNPEAYKFLTDTHARVLRESPGLVWGDGQ